MKRIIGLIDTLLGAGTHRRTEVFPTPRMTEGRLWELRPRRPAVAPRPKQP
ncbi:MAG: hypothetical protein H6744_05580 [Deltaproteobacteria bacterium]|nr:hypothetical protein [Deltaproteobacteria bacterium]MCB9786150.1 hypothetical protein [Deltaproteobacteria bacterium]